MPRHLAALFTEALQSGSHCCTPIRGSESSTELISEGGLQNRAGTPRKSGADSGDVGSVLGLMAVPFRLLTRLLIG
jgi:hypothetical protein